MYCMDRKEERSIVQKKMAMGNHRMAVAMLNGSYCTSPFIRDPSTKITAMKHCYKVRVPFRDVVGYVFYQTGSSKTQQLSDGTTTREGHGNGTLKVRTRAAHLCHEQLSKRRNP